MRTWEQKTEILREKKKPKGTEIYIKYNFSRKILNQKRKLIKLKIIGDMYTLDQFAEEENTVVPE